jgi:hypothetical protein
MKKGEKEKDRELEKKHKRFYLINKMKMENPFKTNELTEEQVSQVVNYFDT